MPCSRGSDRLGPMSEWANAKVKVAKLFDDDREYAGTMSLSRAPAVGDVGKVIYEYPPPDLRMTVETLDPETGQTVWLADFVKEELELLRE
jgi:hypothetical protein